MEMYDVSETRNPDSYLVNFLILETLPLALNNMKAAL